MMTAAEILAAARAMLERQTAPSINPVKWEDLRPASRAGYLEDARVALEAAARVRANQMGGDGE